MPTTTGAVSANQTMDLFKCTVSDLFNFINKYDEDFNKRNVAIVAFDGTQIKSATDNVGTFDGQDDDTQYRSRTTTLSDREVLRIASDKVDTSDFDDGQRDALRILRKRLDALYELEQKRAEEGRNYKEQYPKTKIIPLTKL